MTLDAAARKAQSNKAAKASSEKRKAEKLDRDIGIRLAYRYLINDESLGISEKTQAFAFLLKIKCNPKLEDGVSVLRSLSDAIGIGRSGILKIVNK